MVGGSTGAGKSTLVNSLLGERITESGVLRPTTRSPVLVHHPDDAEWFAPDRILPELPRTTVPSNDTYALRLATSTKLPRGLAILDAPDVDSIDKGNRELAAQLLAAADLWLFVTSAARYADQVPWDYLRLAAERSTSVAVVLDRTSTEAVVEVRGHLARMMTSRGLSDSPLFTVPESSVDADGLLPADAVAPIVGWLHDLAGDGDARGKVISHTLDGAIRHNVLRAHDVADAMDAQIEVSELLYRDIDTIYRNALESFTTQSTDGTLLRGEVQARWQEFVGTGDLLRSVEEKVGRIRDRFVDGVTGKRTRSSDIVAAIETGVFNLVVEAGGVGSADGRAIVGRGAGRQDAARRHSPDLDRASRDFRVKAERTVRDWRQAVLELVRTDGGDKRMTAKFLAFGVNGIGVALMVVMFADAIEARRTAPSSSATSCCRRSSATTPYALWSPRRTPTSSRVWLRCSRARCSASSSWSVAPTTSRPRRPTCASPPACPSMPATPTSSPAVTHETAVHDAIPTFAGEPSDVARRLDGLTQAVTASRGRIDEEILAPAEMLASRASERLRLSGDHTIVALAGATGSGKSSLFNALTDLELAGVGVRRPTTSWALACAWGPDGAQGLLEWMGIPPRHQVSRLSMLDASAEDTKLDGLVLLDLPDHDSTEVSHHLEMDRLVKYADLLVWVLDPQKYADAALHDRYIRPMASYSDVTLVVLNQIDRIPYEQRARTLEDVKRILAAEGLPNVEVVGVSATRGDGIDDLKRLLATRIRAKVSAKGRLGSDITAAAEVMAQVGGTSQVPGISPADRQALDDALVELRGRAPGRRRDRRVDAAPGDPAYRLARRPLARQAAT